jgi:D-alanyl-D-alanine carboxypeptidase (penicillin-binding protein 5/6)
VAGGSPPLRWLLAVLAAVTTSYLVGGPGLTPAHAVTAVPTSAASPDAPALPAALTARSWLVANADNGQILAANGPRARDLPASTMKILTALVVLPGLSPDLRVVVGADAPRVDGTKVGLVPEQSYTVRDLATAMLIASGNDATVALVDAAGGRDAVAARMNALARSLGATDTLAVDPTGLDAPGQLTSVRDLAILGRAALAQPAVSQYLTIQRATFPNPNGGSFQIQNHNLLLGTYAGTIGVKNGYTIAADATYVGAARRGGRTLLVALLRAAPNYGVDARALLDWGFAADGRVDPVGALPALPRPDDGRAGNGTAAGNGDRVAPGAVHGLGSQPEAAGADRRRSGGPGFGWITWAALAVTLAAAGLTMLGRRARRRGAHRRPAGRHHPEAEAHTVPGPRAGRDAADPDASRR